MKIIILTIVFLFLPLPIYANSVVINEVLIEPQQQVELINPTNETIDISNWYLDDNGGTTFVTIPLNTILQPNSCVVFSENFNLNKTSPDSIRLFDNTGTPTTQNNKLIDSYTYDKSTGANISFSRLQDGVGNFSSTTQSIGLYNSTGTSCIFILSPTPTVIVPTVTPSPVVPTLSATPTITPGVTTNNIYITEFMPNPEENSGEWVELYNANNFQVQLDNWYIDDAENAGSSPKVFTLTVPARSYGVVELSSSLFNNDADVVRLLDSQKNEHFTVDYSDNLKGYSLGSILIGNNTSFCIQESSKNAVNKSCKNTVTPLPTTGVTVTPTLSVSAPQTAAVLGEIDSTLFLTPTPSPFLQLTPPPPLEENIEDINEDSEEIEVPNQREFMQIPQLLHSFSIISGGFSVLSFISILFKVKNMA